MIDEEYLDFVRAKPCLVPLCRTGEKTDPDHLIARGWRDWKRNDFTAVNLCRKHHGQRHDWVMEKFEAYHRVNLWRENSFLLMEYFLDEENVS